MRHRLRKQSLAWITHHPTPHMRCHTPVITPSVRLAGISRGVITPDVLQRDQPENAVIPTSVARELGEVWQHGGVALQICA